MGSFAEIERLVEARLDAEGLTPASVGARRMILEVTEALVDVIHAATPDMAPWVEINSLAQGGTAPTAKDAQLALIAVAPHPHMLNRPLVEGDHGLVRAPLHLQLTYLITYLGDPRGGPDCALTASCRPSTPRRILKRPDLQPPLASAVDAIAIRMLSPTADERNQIWGALGRAGPCRTVLRGRRRAGSRHRARGCGARQDAPHRLRGRAMTVIATSHDRLRHVDSPGALGDRASRSSPVRLAPVAWPTGWAARVVGGAVVVTSTTARRQGPTTSTSSITDGVLASTARPTSPVPRTSRQTPCACRLRRRDRRARGPFRRSSPWNSPQARRPPASRTARPSPSAAPAASPVPLAGDRKPGVYSASRVWAGIPQPADLRVGRPFVRKVSLDFTRAKTRIHVVDPT